MTDRTLRRVVSVFFTALAAAGLIGAGVAYAQHGQGSGSAIVGSAASGVLALGFAAALWRAGR